MEFAHDEDRILERASSEPVVEAAGTPPGPYLNLVERRPPEPITSGLGTSATPVFVGEIEGRNRSAKVRKRLAGPETAGRAECLEGLEGPCSTLVFADPSDRSSSVFRLDLRDPLSEKYAGCARDQLQHRQLSGGPIPEEPWRCCSATSSGARRTPQAGQSRHQERRRDPEAVARGRRSGQAAGNLDQVSPGRFSEASPPPAWRRADRAAQSSSDGDSGGAPPEALQGRLLGRRRACWLSGIGSKCGSAARPTRCSVCSHWRRTTKALRISSAGRGFRHNETDEWPRVRRRLDGRLWVVPRSAPRGYRPAHRSSDFRGAARGAVIVEGAPPPRR